MRSTGPKVRSNPEPSKLSSLFVILLIRPLTAFGLAIGTFLPNRDLDALGRKTLA